MSELVHIGRGGAVGRDRAVGDGEEVWEETPRYRVSLVAEPSAGRPGLSLSSPGQVVTFLFDDLEVQRSPQERMLALFCDIRNRLIGYQVAFVGSVSRCVAEPRPILQAALLSNAVGVLLTHNHPSGDPEPSVEDLAFTTRMEQACEAVGLCFLDHIITGHSGRWVSLKRRGAM